MIEFVTQPSSEVGRELVSEARVDIKQYSCITPATIIPTFNHGRTVIAVLESAIALGLPVIVVDDGSTDGTNQLLMEWRARQRGAACEVLTHARNMGKASALATGFAAARELGCTHAASIDADGQLDARDIPALLAAADEQAGALILGCRPARMEACPPRCARGRQLAGLAVRIESGLNLEDTQCGLRVYPLELVKRAGCSAERFSFETEIIVRAAWLGAPVVEVPVRCAYHSIEKRVSHFRPWCDSLHQIGVHARLMLAAVFSRSAASGSAK